MKVSFIPQPNILCNQNNLNRKSSFTRTFRDTNKDSLTVSFKSSEEDGEDLRMKYIKQTKNQSLIDAAEEIHKIKYRLQFDLLDRFVINKGLKKPEVEMPNCVMLIYADDNVSKDLIDWAGETAVKDSDTNFVKVAGENNESVLQRGLWKTS